MNHTMDTTSAPAGALSHIRVLDLSRVFAGPWAGQMLADLGAEVIKVERPVEGDDSRRLGPPFLCDDAGECTRDSGFYLSANRNKKSITVDISTPQGQEIIEGLVASCDVLIANYKVGDLAAIFQGMGGLMAVTGHRDDLPGGGPQKVGLIASDLMAGMYAAVAILAPLAHRDAVSGEGQHIDLALLDSQVAALSHAGMGYLVSGDPLARCGPLSPTAAPSQRYRCQDGPIMLVVGKNWQFAKVASNWRAMRASRLIRCASLTARHSTPS